MDSPLLSIVIPTYNRPSTLANCLESIAQQRDFDDFEIVIVDNATPVPHENEHLVSCYKTRFEKRGIVINYTRHKRNVGIVNNKHAGVKLATGKYVIVTDDDDFYLHKLFFSNAISALLANPECTVLVNRAVKVYDDGSSSWFANTLQNNNVSNIELKWQKIDGNQYFKGFWTKYTPRQCNSVIACRQSLISAGWFDIHCNDQSFHLLPAINHDVLASENVVCAYRKHSREQVQGNTTSSADPVKCFESHTAIKSWLSFADTKFPRRERFVPLIWRMKTLVLKDSGIILWLSDNDGEKLVEYYNLVKRHSLFNFFVLRYFSLAQIRVDYVSADSDSLSIRQKLAYKIRRFFAIGILKLDRLIH
ncbi:MAG: glycosyltransferase involved in cell wall biosynthesis [Gammaproteobacteria bacterium]|jgi:glycosyltransferase involved in cell wall biosynthesis